MKKTLSKNKILVTFLAFLTVLTALFGVLTMPKSVSAEEQQPRSSSSETSAFVVFPEMDAFEEGAFPVAAAGEVAANGYYRVYLTGGLSFAGFGERWVFVLGEHEEDRRNDYAIKADKNGLIIPSIFQSCISYEIRNDCVVDVYFRNVQPSVICDFNPANDPVVPGSSVKMFSLRQVSSGGDFEFPGEDEFTETPYVMGDPVGGKFFRVRFSEQNKNSFKIILNESFDQLNCVIERKDDLFFVPGQTTGKVCYVNRTKETGLVVWDFYISKDLYLPEVFNAATDGFYSATNCELYELTPIGDVVAPIPDTETEEPDAFEGVKDWISGICKDVSTVIKNNVGFTISSSAILVIGGAMVAYVIFKKKR